MSFSLPYIENSVKRVRVVFGGKYLIDSKQAKLVWEKPYYPAYFFPQEELPKKYLEHEKSYADKEVYDVVVDDRRARTAVTSYSSKAKELAGLFTIDFGSMDAWFEEEDEIFVHCKDPYKRVDVLQSSRHVRVEVNGTEVANTRMARFLHETSLRVRTYIPKNDCRMDLLEPSSLITHCPYKGEAKYYHVNVPGSKRQDDIVWWYRNPTPECATIRGYVAFYDEKVDVWVDGEKQKR
ncbi:hypothetical protein DXG03_001734 [Asterophora parasitica]|uniref:DUF427 domain-containing protein n=1 Tax=Asterophora parasitica TaxID=117018 RepID=A0A9P7KF09_9AGAR|nr:hypothetical protein DXG03_001734 [Asterophora parasitica]